MDENEFNTEEFADDDIETAKDAKKTLRRFLRSVGKQKLRLAIVLFSVAFYSFVNIIAPLYSARVVDFMWERIKALRAVGENIAYGRPDASDEEIRAAARAARADFFIRTMPQGYDTVLTNDAENISVGQRQLLTIARVFLADPAILILDEATSSVDTRTEMEIGKAMKALMNGRTSFVIAHRLSTIVDADLILFMKEGNIIEQGDHRTLLEKNGAYAELYNSQFA